MIKYYTRLFEMDLQQNIRTTKNKWSKKINVHLEKEQCIDIFRFFLFGIRVKVIKYLFDVF